MGEVGRRQSMILDAGVFIALENPPQRQRVIAFVREMAQARQSLHTTNAALAQVWRDPARRVPLARLVAGLNVHDFGDARMVGTKCAAAGTSDVVDASLAVLAENLEVKVMTTDPQGMRALGSELEPLP